MHDLALGPSDRVEIGTAFSASHGKAGQAVLESLFKSQEMEDVQIDVGLKAQSSLIRTDSAVKLDTVSDIGVRPAFIVLPDDTEGKAAFRFGQPRQEIGLLVLRMLLYNRGQRGQYLSDRLLKCRLKGVNFFCVLNDFGNIFVHEILPPHL